MVALETAQLPPKKGKVAAGGVEGVVGPRRSWMGGGCFSDPTPLRDAQSLTRNEESVRDEGRRRTRNGVWVCVCACV